MLLARPAFKSLPEKWLMLLLSFTHFLGVRHFIKQSQPGSRHITATSSFLSSSSSFFHLQVINSNKTRIRDFLRFVRIYFYCLWLMSHFEMMWMRNTEERTFYTKCELIRWIVIKFKQKNRRSKAKVSERAPPTPCGAEHHYRQPK